MLRTVSAKRHVCKSPKIMGQEGRSETMRAGDSLRQFVGLDASAYMVNPALAPLPRFPKRFEAHAIGWKGEFHA
jgi:hypothetical protein